MITQRKKRKSRATLDKKKTIHTHTHMLENMDSDIEHS